jgi:hypothetical protein
MKRLARLLVFALLYLAWPGLAGACSVPVFRYALERWPASPYQVSLRPGNSPAPPQRALLEQLVHPAVPANVLVKSRDAFKATDSSAQPGTPPWLMVRYPDAEENARAVWEGPLSPAAVPLLLDSPERRELVRRLARGDSVVFLLLRGEDVMADDAAAALLDRELPRLEKTIVLPEPTGEGPAVQSPLPLRVAFSTLVLSRSDAAERLLVELLVRGEEGLDQVRAPIVFPIFGRGRALGPLYGPDLTGEQIEQAARFLCGACSCQVKELNPGFDLLLSADWDDILGGSVSTDADRHRPRGAVNPTIPSGQPPAATDNARREERPLWLWLVVGAAGLLTVVTGVRAARSRPTG